tara:strand:+ start:7076 stop:7945 length:870 start_codon:yes stop_codon:yes gene_type:complete
MINKDIREIILTLSCPDTSGIVAEVASFMADQGLTIKESNQFGDADTNTFFMRIHSMTIGSNDINISNLIASFSKIAKNKSMDFNIYDPTIVPKLIIMVSKFDHCLMDLLYRIKTKELSANICAVVSNHKNAENLVTSYKIPFHYIQVDKINKKGAEDALESLIKKYDAEVIILARYMQILSQKITEKYNGKIINIHHSFLPSFKGASPYKQAYNRGVKLIGATAHFVTTDLDEGPIIEQDVARVTHATSANDMVVAGRDVERIVLYRAVKNYIERRVLLNKNKTIVFN